MYNFDTYNAFLTIATNIPQRLVLQGHTHKLLIIIDCLKVYISVWLWKDCCLICIYSTFPKSMFQSSFTEDQSNTMMWLQYKISIRACVWDVEETPWARPPLASQ